MSVRSLTRNESIVMDIFWEEKIPRIYPSQYFRFSSDVSNTSIKKKSQCFLIPRNKAERFQERRRPPADKKEERWKEIQIVFINHAFS